MRHHLPTTILLACLGFAFFIYYPGTTGYFLFDDTLNIVDNTLLRIQSLDFLTLKRAAFSGNAGVLGRPISVLTFALNYYFTGLSPYHFKLTNIAIHLANGILVYPLSRQLLEVCRQREHAGISQTYVSWISVAVASAWLLHPLNLTGVLYIVQRMTSLAALFTFLGIISYLYGRQRIATRKTGWIWILASFLLFTPLAALSKENGALLPVFLFVIEFTLFRFETASKGAKRILLIAFGLSVFLPLMAMVIFLIVNPEWLAAGYRVRDFTLTERLMTEARVMWFYVQSIFAPNLSQLGIYHDDIPVSKSLLDPLTTLLSAIGLLLLFSFALLFRKRHPIAAFGILFFLAGHCLESSVLALELVHEHRNYLPIFGPLLALFYYLLCPSRHEQSLKARQTLAVVFILVLGGLTFMRATQWGDHRLMKEITAANHPNSIRSNADIGAFYAAIPATSQAEADEYYSRAYEHFRTAAELSPADTTGLFGLIELNLRYKLPTEKSWVSALAGRIESAPFSATTGNALARLEKCFVAGGCPLSPVTMDTLFEAALRNPNMRAEAKVQVMFAWSDYQFESKHDRDAAMEYAVKAAEIIPKDVESRITLVKMLINMGKIDEAQSQIERARVLDEGFRLNTVTLNELAELSARSKRKSN